MYAIVVELPDAGLLPGLVPDVPDEVVAIDPPPDIDTTPRRYPTRSRRSVVGNQPYDTYAPRMQLLQLGEVQAHRSALSAAQERQEQQKLPNNNREEVMHTTMSSDLNLRITHNKRS